jgi:hypothetical protein
MTRPARCRFRQTGHVSPADGPDELTDRLYALPPADFVAARDEAVKAARAAGDRSGAATIAKLRRPTVAAWLVNLLALGRADQLGELFALGAELRAAQHDLRGPALRELASRRRAAVAALVSEAAAMAGVPRSTLPVAEVEATLVAALADEELADVVRAGRLLKSGRYDGFGEAGRPDLQLIEGGVARDARAERDVKKESKVDSGASTGEAERRLGAAAAVRDDAETAYAAAVDAVEMRTGEVADIEERLTRLRRDRVAAHAALLDAQATQDSLDAARHAANRSYAAAERAAKRAGR